MDFQRLYNTNEKPLEQCANCLHVQTFYDSQRVYKFYQIFPEADSERLKTTFTFN